MIVDYHDKRTRQFADGEHIPAFSGFRRSAEKALDRLEAAAGLADLRTPGLRLEKLHGDRAGQWSVRINDQWRVCFLWPEGSPGPTRVEITDYH